MAGGTRGVGAGAAGLTARRLTGGRRTPPLFAIRVNGAPPRQGRGERGVRRMTEATVSIAELRLPLALRLPACGAARMLHRALRIDQEGEQLA